MVGCLSALEPSHTGAVALLLEAGEWQAAAEWGQAWLQSSSEHLCAPDVAVCTATAVYKDTVRRVEQSLEHALSCKRSLESSLQLLQRFRIAEDLQAELMDTLEAGPHLVESLFSIATSKTLMLLPLQVSVCSSHECLLNEQPCTVCERM